ncbi:MAG: hypothetical protein AAB266_04330 [Nitrospirota bacterium]
MIKDIRKAWVVIDEVRKPKEEWEYSIRFDNPPQFEIKPGDNIPIEYPCRSLDDMHDKLHSFGFEPPSPVYFEPNNEELKNYRNDIIRQVPLGS